MDSFDDDPFEPSPSTSSKDDEKLENVHQLLEEGWFFGELLTRKPRVMLSCYSDPSPNVDQEILTECPDYIPKAQSSSKRAEGSLIRAPSLPPCPGKREENFEYKESRSSSSSKGPSKLTRQLSDQSLIQGPIVKPTYMRKVEGIQGKEGQNRKSKLTTGQPPKHKLFRTPSLPPCIGREQVIEENDDSDITMSRLIRQAMPNSSEIMPPVHALKEMIQSYSMPKYQPPRNWKELGYTNQRVIIKKSQTDLESQEVQGFKDMGFTFDKQDLNPTVVGILPGLRDKKEQNQDQDKVKRPYLSEAWQVQSCAPPIPIWATKNSAEVMKVQLKYWARAVASNVR